MTQIIAFRDVTAKFYDMGLSAPSLGHHLFLWNKNINRKLVDNSLNQNFTRKTRNQDGNLGIYTII